MILSRSSERLNLRCSKLAAFRFCRSASADLFDFRFAAARLLSKIKQSARHFVPFSIQLAVDPVFSLAFLRMPCRKSGAKSHCYFDHVSVETAATYIR